MIMYELKDLVKLYREARNSATKFVMDKNAHNEMVMKDKEQDLIDALTDITVPPTPKRPEQWPTENKDVTMDQLVSWATWELMDKIIKGGGLRRSVYEILSTAMHVSKDWK